MATTGEISTSAGAGAGVSLDLQRRHHSTSAPAGTMSTHAKLIYWGTLTSVKERPALRLGDREVEGEGSQVRLPEVHCIRFREPVRVTSLRIVPRDVELFEDEGMKLFLGRTSPDSFPLQVLVQAILPPPDTVTSAQTAPLAAIPKAPAIVIPFHLSFSSPSSGEGTAPGGIQSWTPDFPQGTSSRLLIVKGDFEALTLAVYGIPVKSDNGGTAGGGGGGGGGLPGGRFAGVEEQRMQGRSQTPVQLRQVNQQRGQSSGVEIKVEESVEQPQAPVVPVVPDISDISRLVGSVSRRNDEDDRTFFELTRKGGISKVIGFVKTLHEEQERDTILDLDDGEAEDGPGFLGELHADVSTLFGPAPAERDGSGDVDREDLARWSKERVEEEVTYMQDRLSRMQEEEDRLSWTSVKRIMSTLDDLNASNDHTVGILETIPLLPNLLELLFDPNLRSSCQESIITFLSSCSENPSFAYLLTRPDWERPPPTSPSLRRTRTRTPDTPLDLDLEGSIWDSYIVPACARISLRPGTESSMNDLLDRVELAKNVYRFREQVGIMSSSSSFASSSSPPTNTRTVRVEGSLMDVDDPPPPPPIELAPLIEFEILSETARRILVEETPARKKSPHTILPPSRRGDRDRSPDSRTTFVNALSRVRVFDVIEEWICSSRAGGGGWSPSIVQRSKDAMTKFLSALMSYREGLKVLLRVMLEPRRVSSSPTGFITRVELWTDSIPLQPVVPPGDERFFYNVDVISAVRSVALADGRGHLLPSDQTLEATWGCLVVYCNLAVLLAHADRTSGTSTSDNVVSSCIGSLVKDPAFDMVCAHLLSASAVSPLHGNLLVISDALSRKPTFSRTRIPSNPGGGRDQTSSFFFDDRMNLLKEAERCITDLCETVSEAYRQPTSPDLRERRLEALLEALLRVFRTLHTSLVPVMGVEADPGSGSGFTGMKRQFEDVAVRATSAFCVSRMVGRSRPRPREAFLQSTCIHLQQQIVALLLALSPAFPVATTIVEFARDRPEQAAHGASTLFGYLIPGRDDSIAAARVGSQLMACVPDLVIFLAHQADEDVSLGTCVRRLAGLDSAAVGLMEMIVDEVCYTVDHLSGDPAQPFRMQILSTFRRFALLLTTTEEGQTAFRRKLADPEVDLATVLTRLLDTTDLREDIPMDRDKNTHLQRLLEKPTIRDSTPPVRPTFPCRSASILAAHPPTQKDAGVWVQLESFTEDLCPKTSFEDTTLSARMDAWTEGGSYKQSLSGLSKHYSKNEFRALRAPTVGLLGARPNTSRPPSMHVDDFQMQTPH